MTDWIRVCRVDDIPRLGARRVARPQGVAVAVFRTADDRVFGDAVACPLHNWSIALADGNARAPDEGCTPSFACQVVDGQVWLAAAELAGKALDLAGPCRRSRA